MRILEMGSNNQVTQAVKVYDELDDKEKSALNLRAGSEISDYVDFLVRYNKKGQLDRVSGHTMVNKLKRRSKIE